MPAFFKDELMKLLKPTSEKITAVQVKQLPNFITATYHSKTLIVVCLLKFCQENINQPLLLGIQRKESEIKII